MGFIEITRLFTSVLKADFGRRGSVISVPGGDEMSMRAGRRESVSHGIVHSKESTTCSVGISAVDLVGGIVSNQKKVHSPSISLKG